MNFAYLICLLVSTAGMAVLDWRFSLFWFHDPLRAAIVHAAGLVMFSLWDLWGIAAHVFARGSSPYLSGIELVPHFTLEEVFFLIFLSWIAMNAYRGAQLWLTRRARVRA